MARYGIALGGNKRNWPMWDNLYASGNTAGDIKYAAHLKVRDYVLPLEFDGQDCDWQAYVEQEVAGGMFTVGDVVDTHWINEGTHINRVVLHNKRAVPGLTLDAQFFDTAGVAVGPVIALNLATEGFTGLGGPGNNIAMPKNGSLQIKITAGVLEDACFGLYVDLVDFKSQHPCVCPVEKCDVPDPTPECFDGRGNTCV